MHTTSEIAGESLRSVSHILRIEYGWMDKDFIPDLDCYNDDGELDKQKYEQWLRNMLVNEMNDRESKKGNDDE